MKLVTLYILKNETESFNQWLCDKRNVIDEIENLSNNPNDFLYIESFNNWIDELDKEDINELNCLIGDFSSYTVHWQNNKNLFNFLREMNGIYHFVIDNDHWQKKSSTELMKLAFEEFDKWILGKSE